MPDPRMATSNTQRGSGAGFAHGAQADAGTAASNTH
jgi:hypothetical protein